MSANISQNSVSSVAVILLLGCTYIAGSARGRSLASQAAPRPGERHKVKFAQRNSLESIVSRYTLVVLQAWKLDPLPREIYGIYSRAPEKLEAAAMSMPPPTIAGLRAEIRDLQRSLAVAPGSRTRRSWLLSHLKAIDTRLRLLAGEHLPLREEARLLFDLKVTPIPMERLRVARAELERLLPGRGSLNERLRAWIDSSRVPADKIELAVRLALEESRRRTLLTLTLPPGEHVTLKFEHGVPYGGWAEARGSGYTVLHINLDRPITLGWIMHFIAHEGYPGHHVALTLLEQTAKRFPEMQVLPPLSPSNTLLEGGADAIAAAMWSDDEMITWMSRGLLPAIGMTHIDLALWRRLQPHVETVYSAVLNVPFLLDRGTTAEATVRFLEHDGLTDRAEAEALVADVRDSSFPPSFALIDAKHSPAAKALRAYLGSGKVALRRYAALWSAPRTPSAVMRRA
jgi:hypothetical protein